MLNVQSSAGATIENFRRQYLTGGRMSLTGMHSEVTLVLTVLLLASSVSCEEVPSDARAELLSYCRPRNYGATCGLKPPKRARTNFFLHSVIPGSLSRHWEKSVMPCMELQTRFPFHTHNP